jgi:hypothetical protein
MLVDRRGIFLKFVSAHQHQALNPKEAFLPQNLGAES